jgi:hypothetical protein
MRILGAGRTSCHTYKGVGSVGKRAQEPKVVTTSIREPEIRMKTRVSEHLVYSRPHPAREMRALRRRRGG